MGRFRRAPQLRLGELRAGVRPRADRHWGERWDKRPREPLTHRLEHPTDQERIRMLAKAGALIAAEIDRIKREVLRG